MSGLSPSRPMGLSRVFLQTSYSPDLTPLIDTVFQLLIFFMLTSSFVFQPGVRIHLPKTVTSDVAHKENVQITVARGDGLYFGEAVVTLNELKARLASAASLQQPVLIRADRQASLGRIVEVWDACRALGISQVHIATDTKQADKLGQTR